MTVGIRQGRASAAAGRWRAAGPGRAAGFLVGAQLLQIGNDGDDLPVRFDRAALVVEHFADADGLGAGLVLDFVGD